MQPPLVRFVGAAIVLACGLATSPARAQSLTRPGPRQGYFVALGLSLPAVQSRDHELGSLAVDYGLGASLRLGQMVNDWLGFGLALDGGQAASGRWRQGYGGLLVEAQVRPWGHLALRLGAGLGALTATDTEGRVDGSKGAGPATYSAAISYDFFPLYRAGSGGWALTPCLQTHFFPGNDFRSYLVAAGVEIAWWRGLERQELEIPPENAFRADP